MPELKPLKRSQLIRYLSELEFEGPYSGKKTSIHGERKYNG